MINPISKTIPHRLPGKLFGTVVSNNKLCIDSRLEDKIFFTLIDLENGKIEFEHQATLLTPWYSLIGLQNDRLILQFFESKQNPDQVSFHLYHLHKKELRAIDQPPPLIDETFEMPHVFSTDHESFDLIQNFLHLTLVRGCEYWEKDHTIIISYYVESTNHLLDRWLVVVQDEKEVFRLKQDSDLKGFAPGSFFTYQNRLIFVQNQQDLHIYEI